MPIGKNAVKRVTNSGYSAVVSKAPDMENSEQLQVSAPTKKAEAVPATKMATPKSESAAAKKRSAPKTVAKKPVAKPEKESARDGFAYVNVGRDLPIYLL